MPRNSGFNVPEDDAMHDQMYKAADPSEEELIESGQDDPCQQVASRRNSDDDELGEGIEAVYQGVAELPAARPSPSTTDEDTVEGTVINDKVMAGGGTAITATVMAGVPQSPTEVCSGNCDEEREDILLLETIIEGPMYSCCKKRSCRAKPKIKSNSKPKHMGKCLNLDHWTQR